MSNYKSLSYISKIFWHFLGPKPVDYVDAKDRLSSYREILTRLESMINDSEEVVLERYIGNGKFYERQFDFAEDNFMANWGTLNSISTLDENKTYLIEEPKALCFCDIPINHLPEHMKKYGDIGIGVRKDVLQSKVNDFLPVHYRPIRNKSDFLNMKDHFSKKDPKERKFRLKRYSKIPTEFSEYDDGYTSKSNTETFSQIYEEREWRTFEKVKLKRSDISFVLLPDRNILKGKTEFRKIQELINSEIGVIYAEELYGE
ncbi:abortive infection system antitoxin AbiGi family protein [Halobacteriovorax marinus]|nr:abortive infection system antitoxin AbiGi family protein [Halobacteriovorax marinus]